MRRLPAVLCAAALAATASCGGDNGTDTTTAASSEGGCTEVAPPQLRVRGKRAAPTAKLEPGKTYTVELQTNCGAFTITLDQKASPNAAAAFFELAKSGFFDGLPFHRIVPSFVIQGGDPTGTGTGGPGFSTVDTPPRNTTYTRGVVAMAKTATEPRGTAGSQFFIVTPPSVALDPDYAVIGRVTKGIGVVLRIGRFGASSGAPTKRILIQKAVAAEH
jgi:cyclophilin family peptidyl-prolyl cis-trans isomerase